jgi:hypothetical protein
MKRNLGLLLSGLEWPADTVDVGAKHSRNPVEARKAGLARPSPVMKRVRAFFDERYPGTKAKADDRWTDRAIVTGARG